MMLREYTSRNHIMVPAAWHQRARDWGEAIAEWCRDRPSYPTLINDIDRQPKVMAHGKKGEVAFALMNDLDPDVDVDWKINVGPHYDVILNCRRVDVKTVLGLYPVCSLIWPINKWPEEFERNGFDVLALMGGLGSEFHWYGWASKDQFRAEHEIAPVGGKLVAGTPHMLSTVLELPVVWPSIPE
jgi:hypothetical protein